MLFAEILVNILLVCVLSFGCAAIVASAFFGIPANDKMRDKDENG
jgi:hypothetical protein|tara:strand:+ start:448 stop:582 length:135 start_codon:yes stop_codon:yes gene_type:complete